MVVYVDGMDSGIDPKPVYDDLDDGPIFNEEPFIGPVFDVVPDFDHVAATVLNFATLTCAVND
jgi:hypothetical protein